MVRSIILLLVKVDKDTAGRTKRLILAVGSYDDVRDASSATSVEGVGLAIVNTYSEEVTVDFDTNGRVTKSVVTYASRQLYGGFSLPSARTTLMEQKPNGRINRGALGLISYISNCLFCYGGNALELPRLIQVFEEIGMAAVTREQVEAVLKIITRSLFTARYCQLNQVKEINTNGEQVNVRVVQGYPTGNIALN